MKTKLLAGGAAALLVVLGVLMWKLQGQASHVGAPDQGAVSAPSPQGSPGSAARRAPGAPAPGPDTPAPDPAQPIADDGSGRPPNRIVRDHRGQPNNAPKSPIVPETVAAIRRGVTPLVKACAEPLAGTTLPPKSRIQVELVAVSAAGKIGVKSAQGKTFEFEDPAFVECVQKAYSQLVIDAPSGQGDAEYPLLMTFPVP